MRAPHDLVGAARAVPPVVRRHAAEGEEQRRLPAATLDALVAAGRMRDAHVPTQHIQASPKLFGTLGRALLGQEIDASTP
jgi:hypothetical protein